MHLLRYKWADDDESYWRVETFPSAAARNRWVRSWDSPAARGENVPAIEVLEHGEWREAPRKLRRRNK